MERINVGKTDVVPIATALHSDVRVHENNDTVPRCYESFGLTTPFRPTSSRLSQILGNALLSVVRAATRERSRLGPFNFRVQVLYGIRYTPLLNDS